MHNDGVEKKESPIDSYTQDHNIDEERYNYIFKKNCVAFNKFSCPERVEESLRKIAKRIIF
jgi:hypothetical protein